MTANGFSHSTGSSRLAPTGASALLVYALFVIGLVSTPVHSAAQNGADDDGEVLSLLSYNIHGISGRIAKDDPRDRMPTIGWLAQKYDIVAVQEDFEYHGELAQQLAPYSNDYRGNGIWGRPDLVLAKILLFPFFLLVPDFSPPYGAGLSIFVDQEHDEINSSLTEAYKDCNGWVSQALDCWSVKGFLRVTVRTEDGAEFDVYNTHLEAGSSEDDAAVRRKQLFQLAAAVERLSDRHAVVIVGDFNVETIRPADRAMILEFRERLELKDSGAAPELANWRERDMILYREGEHTAMEVESAGEALEFTGRQSALSDHAALFARFRVKLK